LALWRFRRDRGELSDFYWTGQAAADFFSYTIKKLPKTADPMVALSVGDPKFERRLAHSVEALQQNVKLENRWRRLCTLMFASSAFERFVLGLTTAAIDSDPTLTPGFPKHIDGLFMKKHGLRIERPDVSRLVAGPWPSRIARYRSLFKSVPPQLNGAVGELEKLRNSRNGVAHRFAVDESGLTSPLQLVLGARRMQALTSARMAVGHKTLIRWLGILGEVSEAIDSHLNKDFIGGYETAAIYLGWSHRPDAFETAAHITIQPHDKSTQERRFNSLLGQLLNGPRVGPAYSKSVIDYVHRL